MARPSATRIQATLLQQPSRVVMATSCAGNSARTAFIVSESWCPCGTSPGAAAAATTAATAAAAAGDAERLHGRERAGMTPGRWPARARNTDPPPSEIGHVNSVWLGVSAIVYAPISGVETRRGRDFDVVEDPPDRAAARGVADHQTRLGAGRRRIVDRASGAPVRRRPWA